MIRGRSILPALAALALLLPVTAAKGDAGDFSGVCVSEASTNRGCGGRVNFTGATVSKSGGTITVAVTGGTPADGSVTTAKLAAAAVTGPKLATGAFQLVTVYARATAGSITLAPALLGMRVASVTGFDLAGAPPTPLNFVVGTDFEATISIAGHLQQSTTATTTTMLWVLLVAAS